MVHTAEGAAQRFAKRDVRVKGAALDPSGLRVLRVAVDDESDARPRNAAHLPPASSPVFAAWSARLGTGAALPNVYLPEAPRLSRRHPRGGLFTGDVVDAAMRGYLVAALDARALRARARIVQWLAVRSVIDVARPVRWTSLGHGPAVPLIGAIAQARDLGAGPIGTFVDACAESLEVTRRLALCHGLDPADHTFMTLDQALDEVPIAFRSQDLVEAVDLLDGSRADEAAAVAQVFSLVRPGGALILSTMLRDRPAPDGTVAWPVEGARSLADVSAMLRDAELPIADAMAYVDDDGVYAVIEVERL